MRWEEGAFNNQQGHEVATEGSGGEVGFRGIWDAAVDDSSMAAWDDDDGYVGGGTAGRLSNSGLRCPS